MIPMGPLNSHRQSCLDRSTGNVSFNNRQLGGLMDTIPQTSSGAFSRSAKAIGRVVPWATSTAGPSLQLRSTFTKGRAQSSGVRGLLLHSALPQPIRSGASSTVSGSSSFQRRIKRSQKRDDRPTPTGWISSSGGIEKLVDAINKRVLWPKN